MTSFTLPDIEPIDWAVVEDAIHDWLVEELDEINDGRVIWSNQSVAQPPYPYISLLRNNEVDLGIDEKRQRTLDDQGKVVGEEPTAGDAFENQEIIYQPIDWTLSIDAHVDVQSGGNDPNCNAMAILGKAKRSLGKTSVNNQLWDAGVAVARVLALVDTSAVVNTVWVSRARLDILVHSTSVASEKQPFIEKVRIVSQPLGVDFTVDAS